MPDDTTETVAEHSARLQPSINLHVPVTAFYVQLLWYPMYYPEGMKARVSPESDSSNLEIYSVANRKPMQLKKKFEFG